MPKVKIVESTSVVKEGDEEDMELTEVYVDGKFISIGYFGGKPEDNSRDGDYDWVSPMLLDLAKALGSDAEIIKQEMATREWEKRLNKFPLCRKTCLSGETCQGALAGDGAKKNFVKIIEGTERGGDTPFEWTKVELNGESLGTGYFPMPYDPTSWNLEWITKFLEKLSRGLGAEVEVVEFNSKHNNDIEWPWPRD